MNRVVNADLATYMTEVNKEMARVTGVTYAEVFRDLHGDISALRTTFQSSIPAKSFVSGIVRTEGLEKVDSHPEGEAREINLRKLAMREFVRENPEWFLTATGGAISSSEAGEAYVIAAAKGREGGWGFSVSRVPGHAATVTADGLVLIEAGTAHELIGGGADISDALAVYDRRLELRAAPDQGMRP